MAKNKILKLIYNKKNFIKLLIICILAFIIYLLYNRINSINKINEGFVTYPTPTSALFVSNSTSINNVGTTENWIVPDGVTQAKFTVIGGKGGNSKGLGGYGGKVISRISVTPGSTYIIGVSSVIYSNSVGASNPFSNNSFKGGGGGPIPGGGSSGGSGGAATTVFLILSAIQSQTISNTTPMINLLIHTFKF